MVKCAICGDTIQKDANGFSGHNPEPVAKGRCCDECNLKVVLPLRIMLTKKER